ncbi:MAG: restriction endonuclease subunit S [Chitinophagales bacterium]|nr:restriction endonuclease subunit S [Chitinophagales bacterium]
MEGWTKSTIASIGEIISGSTPKTNIAEYWDGDIVWITPSDLSRLNSRYVTASDRKISRRGLDSCSAHLVAKNNIVISSRAPIGYLAIPKTDFTTNQGCKSIKLKEGHSAEFHYYNLLFNIDDLKRVGEGTTFHEISKQYLENIEISYPSSYKEQSRIAEILNSIDQAIEQTESLIAKYRRIKTGLMHDLLTRGIDEHGNLRSESTHQFKESELGRIPVEWEVKSLEDVCEVIQDGTHFSPATDPSGAYRYITSKNIRFGEMDLTDCEFVNENEHRAIYRRCAVRFGDVLLTKDGANTGNACLNPLKEEFSLLSSVALIRGEKDALLNDFILQFLLSFKTQKNIKDEMSGNAITRLTLTKINALKILLPGFEEQKRIIKRIDSFDQTSRAQEDQLKKLHLLKTGLMQDLLSGKVRVKREEN